MLALRLSRWARYTPAIVFFIASSEAPGFTVKFELQMIREPDLLSLTSIFET